MTYPNGWHYVKGPMKMVWSDVSSTATFRAKNPVILGLGHTVCNFASSDDTAIYGIATSDAADSLGGVLAGKQLVMIPTEDTVFAIKVGTGGTASELSASKSFEIEISGNYVIGNEDSTTTPFVIVVPRDDGSTIDSADSTVWVNILKGRLGPFGASDTAPRAVA